MAYTTIDKPDEYFNTVLYTGTGSARTISGVGFQPDWVWLKQRNTTRSHWLFDSVRGATERLHSDSTDAEATEATTLTSFNSDGFSLGSSVGINQSSGTYASWNWLADNTSGSSNTDGDITSTVSANTTSGFSVGTYTGNGTDGATVGTGLTGLSLVIAKCRNATGGWVVKHQSLSGDNNVYLQITNAAGSAASAGSGGIGALNDSTFPLVTGTSGASSSQVNKSGNTHVFYAFAEKKGFSKFGSYTGNGNSDGTFVYTGFKPSFVIVKQTNTTRNWLMFDNKRNEFNIVDKFLIPNTSGAEQTSDFIDFTSNGFKCRTTDTGVNESGGTYIYMAFAENPFVTSTGIPTTAR